ncbi:MAG TPA: sugar kinase [Candidatus Bathyarchaeota archaeon]|nr:sugar kinase [Candidatus Bathyarchaeota archaeon]
MFGQVEVVTIGETMLMLTPPRFHLIENCENFRVMIGGSEANVAIGLQRLGVRSGWISKVVDNALGRRIVNEIRGYGVDVSRVVWTDKGRVGLFFVEFGVEPRPSKTIYDRAGSAVTTLKPEEVDWEYVKQAKILHQTGITPALSEVCEKLTLKAAEKAREMGLKNSFDVNYRSLLWKPEEMRKTLSRILPYVDVLISTLRDAHLLIEDEPSPEDTAARLKKEYGSEVVVITLGEKGSLALSDRVYHGRSYRLKEVNRLGTGDAFDAGFIYGYLKGSVQVGLEYAAAMAALKFTVPQNIPLITREDVENLIGGVQERDIRR